MKFGVFAFLFLLEKMKYLAFCVVFSIFLSGISASITPITTVSPSYNPCPASLTIAEQLTGNDCERDPAKIWTDTNADCYYNALLDNSKPLSSEIFRDYLFALLSIAQIVEPRENPYSSFRRKMDTLCSRLGPSISQLIIEKHQMHWKLRYSFLRSILLGNGTREEREGYIRGVAWLATPFWNMDQLCSVEVYTNSETFRIVLMEKIFRQKFIVGEPNLRVPDHITIIVDRNNMLESSVAQLLRGSFAIHWQAGWIGGIRIQFAHEPASDTGGVFHDWVGAVFQAFIDEEILIATEEGTNSFTINIEKEINADYLRLAGIVMGLCLLQDGYIPVPISLGFFKILAHEVVVFENLKNEYPILWKNLQDFEPLEGMLFVVNDRFGNERELIQNGNTTLVTSENFPRYQRVMAKWKLVESVATEWSLVKQGFYLITGYDFQNGFHLAVEIQAVLCKLREPSINDLASKIFITWPSDMPMETRNLWRDRFRKLLISLDRESLLGKFIQFITGLGIIDSRKIEFGFEKFENNDERFPRVSTCSRSLWIPLYSSEEILVTKIRQALENQGSREFGLV